MWIRMSVKSPVAIVCTDVVKRIHSSFTTPNIKSSCVDPEAVRKRHTQFSRIDDIIKRGCIDERFYPNLETWFVSNEVEREALY